MKKLLMLLLFAGLAIAATVTLTILSSATSAVSFQTCNATFVKADIDTNAAYWFNSSNGCVLVKGTETTVPSNAFPIVNFVGGTDPANYSVYINTSGTQPCYGTAVQLKVQDSLGNLQTIPADGTKRILIINSLENKSFHGLIRILNSSIASTCTFDFLTST